MGAACDAARPSQCGGQAQYDFASCDDAALKPVAPAQNAPDWAAAPHRQCRRRDVKEDAPRAPTDCSGHRVIRILVAACNYQYDPRNALTGVMDGENMCKMAHDAGVEDIVFMRDDFEFSDPLFPTKNNVKRQMRDIGLRCASGDLFIFFYAGHGANVPCPKAEEDESEDDAFCTPGPQGQLRARYFFVDDDFAEAIDKVLPEGVRVLVLADCCHSGTIADIDTYHWGKRVICSLTACRDNETDADTGHGGMLTIAIQTVTKELSAKGDRFSIQAVFDDVRRFVKRSVGESQHVQLKFANADPRTVAWPLQKGAAASPSVGSSFHSGRHTPQLPHTPHGGEGHSGHHHHQPEGANPDTTQYGYGLGRDDIASVIQSYHHQLANGFGNKGHSGHHHHQPEGANPDTTQYGYGLGRDDIASVIQSYHHQLANGFGNKGKHILFGDRHNNSSGGGMDKLPKYEAFGGRYHLHGDSGKHILFGDRHNNSSGGGMDKLPKYDAFGGRYGLLGDSGKRLDPNLSDWSWLNSYSLGSDASTHMSIGTSIGSFST